MENTNRQMAFVKSFLQGLDDFYINSLKFSSSLHPKSVYEEKLMIFSDIHGFGYNMIELIDYSKKHQFLSEYINDLKNGGHPHLNGKVSENIDWYLKEAEECLLHVHNITISPEELSDFFLNAIKYSHLDESKSKDKISYVWNMHPDKELPELYSLMINKYKLIVPETTYEQFKAVFTGQPIDVIDKIERTKKFTIVLLTYFVNELFHKSNPNDYLSIAESCFDGAKNLSQAQNNYFNNQNKLPKNHTLIDSLLKDLQNP
jgi:hypothetical protein